MSAGEAKTPQALGFLTVVEHPQYGLFGGYLVLNLSGRPLEFHCTTPIKPNRAQQILYGPTLEPYLYGEQIGLTLVTKAAAKPLAVCTDLPPVLAVRPHVAMPVVLVLGTAEAAKATTVKAEESGPEIRFDPADGPAGQPHLVRFRLGRNQLAVEPLHGADQTQVAARLESIAQGFDLFEPFARIREALEEAQRGSR
jgi:hypothetical protein